jgi:hypothetical protein
MSSKSFSKHPAMANEDACQCIHLIDSEKDGVILSEIQSYNTPLRIIVRGLVALFISWRWFLCHRNDRRLAMPVAQTDSFSRPWRIDLAITLYDVLVGASK